MSHFGLAAALAQQYSPRNSQGGHDEHVSLGRRLRGIGDDVHCSGVTDIAAGLADEAADMTS
jgi:hypothetical protein